MTVYLSAAASPASAFYATTGHHADGKNVLESFCRMFMLYGLPWKSIYAVGQRLRLTGVVFGDVLLALRVSYWLRAYKIISSNPAEQN